jgi:N-acylneuraminate cytidylyltransferase
MTSSRQQGASSTQSVAIIPARGGSKGIPRKNIRPFCGRPLIVWTIEDAIESGVIGEVYVSTDDPEIAAVARAHGAEAIERPAGISQDLSSSEAALLHALDTIERDRATVDAVVFLQATSPLRTGRHLAEAMQRFRDSGADSLLSVCPSHLFLWEERGGWAVPLNYDPLHRPMRQQMAQYRENGSIYIFTPKLLRETGCRLGGRIVLYPMPERCCVDIDTLADWAEAEQALQEELSHDHPA